MVPTQPARAVRPWFCRVPLTSGPAMSRFSCRSLRPQHAVLPSLPKRHTPIWCQATRNISFALVRIAERTRRPIHWSRVPPCHTSRSHMVTPVTTGEIGRSALGQTLMRDGHWISRGPGHSRPATIHLRSRATTTLSPSDACGRRRRWSELPGRMVALDATAGHRPWALTGCVSEPTRKIPFGAAMNKHFTLTWPTTHKCRGHTKPLF